MNVGRTRIANILKEEMSEEEELPRQRALGFFFSGLVFCQFLGFAVIQVSQSLTSYPNALAVGGLLGGVLAGLFLYAGYFFYSASGETDELALRRFKGLEVSEPSKPVIQLLRDFHQAFCILTQSDDSKEETQVSAASEMISHLLNNGMTPTGRLERSLVQAGYSKSVTQGALDFLQEGGFVTVRANGVSLVKTRRRLFL